MQNPHDASLLESWSVIPPDHDNLFAPFTKASLQVNPRQRSSEETTEISGERLRQAMIGKATRLNLSMHKYDFLKWCHLPG